MILYEQQQGYGVNHHNPFLLAPGKFMGKD